MSLQSRKALIKLSCFNVLLAASLPSSGRAEYMQTNYQAPSSNTNLNNNTSTQTNTTNIIVNSSINTSINGTINTTTNTTPNATPNATITGTINPTIPDMTITSPINMQVANDLIVLSGSSAATISRTQSVQGQQFNMMVGQAVGAYHGSNNQNTNLAQFGTMAFDAGADSTPNSKARIWTALTAGRSFDSGNKGENQSSSGHNWAMMAGIDNDYKEDLMIGFSVGGGTSRFKTPAAGNSQVDSNGGQVAAYAMQRWGRAYLSGILNVGMFAINSQRTAAPVSNSLLKGDTISYGSTLQFETGYRFDINKELNITPFIAVKPGLTHQNGYHEKGEDSATAGSIFKSSVNRHLSSSLGIEAQNSYKLNDSWNLEGNIRAAFVHEFNPTSKHVIALQIEPNTSFINKGSTHLENAARVSAGLQLNKKDGMSYFIKANSQLADRSQYYEGQLGLRYTW
jgi:hypothetical protein